MKTALVIVVGCVLVVGVAVVALFAGVHSVPISALWGEGSDVQIAVLWELRLPRICVAFLAGAGLAAAGAAFQAVFRNPLATPFTLGVASGASLGVALYVAAGFSFATWFLPGRTWFALAGAMATVGLVYALTRLRRGFSNAGMLLAGVAISYFFSSLILLIQYLSDFTQSYRILRWIMGGLAGTVGFADACSLLPGVLLGCGILLFHARELNLLACGGEIAAARGVAVDAVKRRLFFAASLAVGTVVSICGPIGFVGLMVPHMCRLAFGPDHHRLLPATWLFGGAFLIACDTAARCIMPPTELPVGVLTAILGGPFFLALLLTRTIRAD